MVNDLTLMVDGLKTSFNSKEISQIIVKEDILILKIVEKEQFTSLRERFSEMTRLITLNLQ